MKPCDGTKIVFAEIPTIAGFDPSKLAGTAVDAADARALEVYSLQTTVNLDGVIHVGTFHTYGDVAMSALERCFEVARTRVPRVVFPETSEPRVIEAMARLKASLSRLEVG